MATTNKFNWTYLIIAGVVGYVLWKNWAKLFPKAAQQGYSGFGGGGGGDSLNNPYTNQNPNPPPFGASLGAQFSPKSAGQGGAPSPANPDDANPYPGASAITNLEQLAHADDAALADYSTEGNTPGIGLPQFDSSGEEYNASLNFLAQPVPGDSPFYDPSQSLTNFAATPDDGSTNPILAAVQALFDQLSGSSPSSDAGLVIPSADSATATYADTSGLNYAPDSSPSNDVAENSGDNGYDVASYGGNEYDQGGNSGNEGDGPSNGPDQNSGDSGSGGGGGDTSGGDGGDDSGD